MVDEFQRTDGVPALASGAVHVWRAQLTLPPAVQSSRYTVLAVDEKKRAARFHFARDRERYIAARITLRRLLAGYLSIEPAEVAFRYGPRGKPALDVRSMPALKAAAEPLDFNVAHSGDIALYAFTRGRSVGIDLESLRNMPDALTIARHHFTGVETKLLENVSPAEQGDRFFRIWTRKESVIKAIGVGLSLPLTEFDVSFGLDGAAASGGSGAAATSAPAGGAWHTVRVGAPHDTAWAIHELLPAPGYRAALTIAGGGAELCLWDVDQQS